jgi:hypothetical protein
MLPFSYIFFKIEISNIFQSFDNFHTLNNSHKLKIIVFHYKQVKI